MTSTKKEQILNTALRLFALQGYAETTTFQIAQEAQVTEPLLYYHFKNKEEIFTKILEKIFAEYKQMILNLPSETVTVFDKIENLIRLHLNIASMRPLESRLILAHCPAKLIENGHFCSKILQEQEQLLLDYLITCLKEGMAKKEFKKLDAVNTALVILCFINGLFRRKLFEQQHFPYEETAIVFCRNSLLL
ncbi:MAG: TetR/AcrR family transcriptional regulator [Desulfonauticus sp.]|nr:TetR/AcrR family transcriptional regulator [Desulfonauticus sp.]